MPSSATAGRQKARPEDDSSVGPMRSTRSTRTRSTPRRADDSPVRHQPYSTNSKPSKSKPASKAKARPRTTSRSVPKKQVPEEEPEEEDPDAEGDYEDEHASDAEGEYVDENGHPSGEMTYNAAAAAHHAAESPVHASSESPQHEPTYATLDDRPITPPSPNVLQNRKPMSPSKPPYPNSPPRPRTGASLASLADGPEGNSARPPYPYSTLIRYAIEGSERGKLTLADLYTAIEDRFPWFKSSGSGWKNSIRHNLSLNKSFVKVPRPLTEPGKGSYWCINHNASEHMDDGDDPLRGGSSRSGAAKNPESDEYAPPKKKRGRKKAADAAEAGPADESPPSMFESGQVQVHDNAYTRYETSEEYGRTQERYEGERELVLDEDMPPPPRPNEGFVDPNAAYYQPYGHPPQQPMNAEAAFGAPPQASPSGYYNTAGPTGHGVPFPVGAQEPEFVDDRPDRTAPRTIYNHASTGGSGMFGPPPLGSLGASTPNVPYGSGVPYGSYGRFPGPSSGTYTSSLGGAMGPPPAPSTNTGATSDSSVARGLDARR